MILFLSCLLVLHQFSEAAPGYGLKRVPQRALIFGGYYSNPLRIPQGSMTAILAGDAIATNSFAGDQFYPSFPQDPSEEEEQVPNQNRFNEDPEEEEDQELSTTIKPKRIPKRKPQKPKPDEDEEEDEENSGWPFKSGKVPSYNAFFPIMIGGGSRSRSGDEEYSSYPGSATAIANSFSTGKGGVASSHAISFGDPYAAQMFRNGFFKKSKRGVAGKQ